MIETGERRPSRRRLVPSRLRLPLLLLLVLAVVGVALLYTQRHTITSLLTGTRFVGGQPAVTSINLPPGFRATVYASGLQVPRFFAFAPDGTLFTTERGTGSIVALADPSGSGRATVKKVVATGLDEPSSIVFYKGFAYVGEQSRVTRFTLGADDSFSDKRVLVNDLPPGGNHFTRTVLIGPDNKLYVSIGSSCNNCVESNPHRASVWVYDLDGSGGRLYAKGLRNAVGMAANPWTHEVWVTDMGRDLLGDDTPPETVYALQDGGNYGWPRCQAGTIIDPDLGHAGDCNGIVQPLIDMQAHSAPLGLAFYNATAYPQAYHGLFVAFHGSWNRSVPTGYKVIYIPLDASGHIAGHPQDFATGFLKNTDDASGRPTGVIVGRDGALYLSDDKAGFIYRIAYSG
jgi:glucose/arabinose dehydrogenase